MRAVAASVALATLALALFQCIALVAALARLAHASLDLAVAALALVACIKFLFAALRAARDGLGAGPTLFDLEPATLASMAFSDVADATLRSFVVNGPVAQPIVGGKSVDSEAASGASS